MNIDEFLDLIQENSAKGLNTEFMKLEFSIDDPRKDKSPGIEVEETFFVKYSKDMDRYFIYYPDKDKEIALTADEMDGIFYTQRWGFCIHRQYI